VSERSVGSEGSGGSENRMNPAKRYKDLVAWQKADDLAYRIFKLTDSFPNKYTYDLTNQMRRSALSIPTNLAEGSASPHTKELLQFINIANRSLSETQYLLEFAGKLDLINGSEIQQLDGLCDEISKMLRSLAISIKKRKAESRSH
jgi:four helix bundle protein